MGAPAVVANDRIVGMCAIHQIPAAAGAPTPAPPMPFSAPLIKALATSVLIKGKPAVVVGSSGLNVPPHVGLHASDPYMVPTMQEGRVTSGSATVLIEGKPAATSSSSCTLCATPGSITPTVMDVLIG